MSTFGLTTARNVLSGNASMCENALDALSATCAGAGKGERKRGYCQYVESLFVAVAKHKTEKQRNGRSGYLQPRALQQDQRPEVGVGDDVAVQPCEQLPAQQRGEREQPGAAEHPWP